jgi:hypothetical protein
VQNHIPTRLTDLPSPNDWPARRRRTRRQRTVADRPTATRCLTATETPAHPAAAVHMAAAPSPEIDEAAGRHSPADRQHQHADRSAAAHDETYRLPDDREAGR